MSACPAPGGVTFLPVEAAGLSAWGWPDGFSCVDRLGQLPVADTELLNLSHFCPIAIDLASATPHVVCLLGQGLLRQPCVNAEGRWLAPYRPLALRSLPFRSRLVLGQRVVEIAPELAMPPEGAALALLKPDGSPAPDYAAVLGLLGLLERGTARLADAARLLLAADLLIPIGREEEPRGTLMVVSGERLGRLSPQRAAALAADRCLALDLAAASLFSRRWLAEGLVQDRPTTSMAPAPVPDLVMFDHGLRDAIDQPLMLDASPLFSFDELFGSSIADRQADTLQTGPDP